LTSFRGYFSQNNRKNKNLSADYQSYDAPLSLSPLEKQVFQLSLALSSSRSHCYKCQATNTLKDFTEQSPRNSHLCHLKYHISRMSHYIGLSTVASENMTKREKMCIRHKVWGCKSIQDFSKLFGKLQEEKDELRWAISCLACLVHRRRVAITSQATII